MYLSLQHAPITENNEIPKLVWLQKLSHGE